MTSPDGITWTSGTNASDYGWRSVAYGNGTWVVISSDGSGKENGRRFFIFKNNYKK
jgi:hypothetical protein